MKPVILLTGKNGQIGRELTRLLPSLGELTTLGREQLDLSKPEEVRQAIRRVRPQIIINAAAYTAVDGAESDEATARAINAEAPAIIAAEARKIGACLIHYSTDYVFDGLKTAHYDEEDPANPQNVYGKTKLEGEEAIRQSNVPHLIFRTEWVYSTEGRNFLLAILRLASHREELRIVCDQIGAPTLNREVARATMEVLAKAGIGVDGQRRIAEVSGIYHMTAAGETTWHGFATAILEEVAETRPVASWFLTATNKLPLVVRRVIPIPSKEYPTAARRPAYSLLRNARLLRTFGVQLSDWRSQLRSVFLEHLRANAQTDS
jgi:dTDP-4-dehydrorhamnose reductase